MANIKSAKKRAKQNEVRQLKNVSRRSDIKSACRKVLEALEKKDIDNAKSFLRDAESKISRAKGKKLLKKNTASRKVGRLAKKVAKASK